MSTRLSAVDYVAAGFALVPNPIGHKNPIAPGWQIEQNAIRTIEQADRLNGGNIGIAHRWCGTCAIDVDDYLAATAWLSKRGIALARGLARGNRCRPDQQWAAPIAPSSSTGCQMVCRGCRLSRH